MGTYSNNVSIMPPCTRPFHLSHGEDWADAIETGLVRLHVQVSVA